jgi:glycine/D-amino acid oxidase-like deaminating enzyme
MLRANEALIFLEQEDISDYLGAFPIPPKESNGTPALKLMEEQFSECLDPAALAQLDRSVSAAEVKGFYERKVLPRLRGVKENCVRAEVCLYTSTPSEDFVIDTSRECEDVLLVSACSGHGFKHSAAIGEACAEWAAGAAGAGGSGARSYSSSAGLSLEPFRRWRGSA